MKLLLVAASVIAADAAKTSVKILFAGNSLTSVNDLPTMLKNLCANAGSDITVTTQSSVVGGSAFVEHSVTPEHYNDPGLDGIVKSVEKIRQGGWNYVVLQDQSGNYFQLEPPNLDSYGRVTDAGSWETYPHILVEEVQKHNSGAIPIFFMNWPRRDAPVNDATQWEVTRPFNYVTTEERVMCAPFGLAFLTNSKAGRTVFTDNVHPSGLTQYTNACIMYAIMQFSSFPCEQRGSKVVHCWGGRPAGGPGSVPDNVRWCCRVKPVYQRFKFNTTLTSLGRPMQCEAGARAAMAE